MSKNSEYKTLDYEFGTLLQSLRKKTKLFQSELAGLVGVTERAFKNWEAGESYPRINHLRKLIEIFLDKNGFTPQEEQNEANFFWDKATSKKSDVKDAFNVEWFNILLQEKIDPDRSSNLPEARNFPKQDWSEAVDNRVLYGREHELVELEHWVINEKLRVISIFGMGGIGKTGLIVSLAHQLTPHFDYVIFRTLHNAPPLNELLDSILRFLLDGQLTVLPAQQNEKLTLVMEYFRSQRCLLVLDNLETIMQDGLAAGEYRKSFTEYADFIRRICDFSHKSCLLITSREKPQQLVVREERNSPVRSLALKGLDKKSCQAILNGMNININEEQGIMVTERYGGNPLALKLIAEPIREVFGGDIGAFLASRGFQSGGIDYILDQHFERLSQIEQDILYWLALSREPLDLEKLQKQSLLQIGKQTLGDGIKALFRRVLIEQTEDKSGFTLQEVVTEYITERLINQLNSEIVNQAPDLLCRYPLLQTQLRASIRQIQLRVIIEPLLKQLCIAFRKPDRVIFHLKHLLESLQILPQIDQGYAGGNLLNLLIRLDTDLSGWDFENLALWQVNLMGVELHDVNMRWADLSETSFTEANMSAYSLAYNPDGKKLAVGCANGSVKIWQVEGLFGNQLLECQGHTNLVATLAFSPDGTILASGSADGTIRLWELVSGSCLKVLNGSVSTVRSVAFSPDGKWLASGGFDQKIYLWQVSDPRLFTTINSGQGWVMSLAFSPDGKWLASGGYDNTVKLWDFSNPSKEVISALTLEGHSHWISSVAFSPVDSNLLASGSADQTVRLWSVSNSSCTKTFEGHTGSVMALAFSPDGKVIASSGLGNIIRLWSVNNSTIKKDFPVGNAAVTALAFNPDGGTLASSSGEIANLNLWSVKNLERLDTLQGYTNLICTMAISPERKWLGIGGIENSLVLWNITKSIQSFPAPVTLNGHSGYIGTIAFSSQNDIIATGSSDTTIKLWHLTNRKCFCTLIGHEKMVTSVVFSPDSNLLVSGDDGGNLKLWSPITGKVLNSVAASNTYERIRNLIFSPNGKNLISGTDHGLIQLWNVDTEKAMLYRMTEWHNQTELLMALAFNHDGTRLFSGGSGGIIRSWDVATGKYIASFEAHKSLIWSIVYNPIEQKLATGGEDGFVYLWDVTQPHNPLLLACFEHTSKVKAVAFSPDGKQLFSAGEGGFIKLWDLENKTLTTTIYSRAPYEGLDITAASGLTEAQRSNLLSLGAIETEN